MSNGEVPFGEDVMTIIMGIEPSAPGQHGMTTCPVPTEDAISLICNIKCMCEDFLIKCGKGNDDTTADNNNDNEDVEETEGE